MYMPTFLMALNILTDTLVPHFIASIIFLAHKDQNKGKNDLFY